MNSLYRVTVVPVAILVAVGVLLALTRVVTTYQFYRAKSAVAKREPPTVPYWIPWLGNLLAFMTCQSLFFNDIAKLAQDQPVLRLRLGPIKAYVVTGSRNVQSVFRKSKSLSFELFLRQVMENPLGYERDEIDIFFKPLTPDGKTFPLDVSDKVHHEYATALPAANELTTKFVEIFSTILDAEPQGVWQEVFIFNFLRMHMSRSSIAALCGSRIFIVSPTVVDDFWAWSDVFLNLTYQFPRWAFPRGYDARDKLHASMKRWLADAWNRCDPSDPGGDVDWEENFGSRLMRARERMFKETFGGSLDSRASSEMGILLALNGNAIPATAWAIMNLLERPDIFSEVYKEVFAVAKMSKTVAGRTTVDVSALMAQPWLMAVYTETLRLRVHFNVIREIIQDIEIDGQVLKRGHIVMAPTYIAHTLDPSWTTGKYPVGDFYPERFLVFDKKGSEVPKFSTGEAGGKMFPYGGGVFLCPGRNFAKQEIMAAIALVLLKFDFEALGYVKMDGCRSDRGPRRDEAFAGSGVTPPDRDLRVRMKRRE